MAHRNSQAVYVINNAKEDVDSFELPWELMKAFVKPNIHTCLSRGGLSKHLQNSITHIFGVENDKVEHPPLNHDTPRRCKMCFIPSHGKGHKSPKDSMGKVNLDAENANNPFVESTQLPFMNCVPKHKIQHFLLF